MNLRGLGQTSDLGLRTLTSRMPQRVAVGFTSPTLTYDRMRAIDASARALDDDVDRHLRGTDFQRAWKVWYEGTWRPFAGKYDIDDPNAYTNAKLAAAFHSDELAREVDGYDKDLHGWYDRYRLQKSPNGQPVPPPHGEPPRKGELPKPAGGGGSSLPWYFWMGLGVVGVGLGYLVYRQASDAYAVKRGIVRTLSAGRDPSPPSDAEGLPTLHDIAQGKL